MRNFWLLVVVLLLPAAVSGQEAGAASPQLYRKWDAGGGFGIGNYSWNAELSRYWTAHLKTTVEAAAAERAGYTSVTSDGHVSRQTTWTTGPAVFSGTVGYQFFDNAFMHPYVLGGVRMVSASNSTHAYLSAPPYGPVSTETQPSRLFARPVAGGGLKLYFGDGRAFMRTEFLTFIDPYGRPRGALQLGAGFDF